MQYPSRKYQFIKVHTLIIQAVEAKKILNQKSSGKNIST